MNLENVSTATDQTIPFPVAETPTAPTHPRIKQRVPKKIYVAMVLGDSLTKEAGLFWEELGERENDPENHFGYTFVRTRVSGYGLAKCRNTATWMARQSDCAKFVFIDSDVKPSIGMLMRLISHDEVAVSGFYPKKRADRLEWVGNLIGTPARADGLAESLDFGGGFCCLDLTAIDQLVEKIHEEVWYVCEDEPFKDKIMHDLWSNGRVIDEWRGRVFPRYLTEDFYMCWRFRRQLGVKVFMDTFCQVGHVGPVDYLELHTKIKELEAASIFRAPN